LWAARDVVRAFVVRNVRVRYRQAALGVAWAAAQPLALLVPLTLFLRERTPRIDDVPVAASTLVALVAWTYLGSAVTAGSSALVNDAALVRKTWFPRQAPVLAATLAGTVELAVGTAVAVAAMPILGGRLRLTLLSVPLAAAALVLTVTAVAVPLAALNAIYRDVRHALPFGVLLWMFASPVLYPLDRVDPQWRSWYAVANPAAAPIEAYRRAIAHGEWPPWGLLAAGVASAVTMAAIGHLFFRRIAPTIADVV
jgi:ABC-type polysaccharide/polyol phosphate export permease